MTSRAPRMSKPCCTVSSPASAQAPLDVIGKFTAPITVGSKNTQQTIYVVKDLHTSLLGRPAIEALNLIVRVDAVDTGEKYKAAFPKLFEGLGSIPGEYTIQLEEHATPFSLNTPRRVALPLLSAVT